MKRGDKFLENFEKTLDKLEDLWYNVSIRGRHGLVHTDSK